MNLLTIIQNGNRRNAKALYKLHEDVIGYYKHIIGPVKTKTMRKYGRIVTQFMIFSPTLDPKDVPEFLNSNSHKKH